MIEITLSKLKMFALQTSSLKNEKGQHRMGENIHNMNIWQRTCV